MKTAGISADALKWIALLTMLCDHAGAVLFAQYPVMRLIGRTAFPLFVWLLVEGFFHTSSRKKYLGRMAFFALVSEPFLQMLAAVGTVAAAMAAAELFCVDYGGSGPLLAALFYCYKRKGSPGLAVSFLIFCLSMGLLTAMVEIFGIVSVPLIARYNGKRTGRGRGRLFYLFYPLHLLILYGISMLGKNMLA